MFVGIGMEVHWVERGSGRSELLRDQLHISFTVAEVRNHKP